MKVKVIVTLKNGVLDPQGKAIQQTLNGMNFPEVKEIELNFINEQCLRINDYLQGLFRV